jgi:phosphoribulokinase
VAQRGYLLEEVIRQIVERQEDFRRHIEPQQAFADRVVRFYPSPGYLRARTNGHSQPDGSHLNVQVIQRNSLPRVDLSDILDASPAVREYTAEYLCEPAVIVEIDGDVAPEAAARVEARVWDHMPSHRHLRPDQIGTFLDGVKARHSDPLALAQLLIAYRIVAARDEVSLLGGDAPALARTC